MVTVSSVVTTHANIDGLHAIVDQLHSQTRPPDEILVFASDLMPQQLGGLDVTRVVLDSNRNDWGHHKRAMGLAEATCDLVGFFNDDDIYEDTYIQRMTETILDADLVFCDFEEKSLGGRVMEAHPVVGRITSGNFLVRTELARKVGYNGRHYEADGMFVVECVSAGARWRYLPECLYTHL